MSAGPAYPTALPDAPDPQMAVVLNDDHYPGVWVKPPVRTATTKPTPCYCGSTAVGAMRVAGPIGWDVPATNVKKGHRDRTPS